MTGWIETRDLISANRLYNKDHLPLHLENEVHSAMTAIGLQLIFLILPHISPLKLAGRTSLHV